MTNELIALTLKGVFLFYILFFLFFLFFFKPLISKLKKILIILWVHFFLFISFLIYLHISLKPTIINIKNGNFYHFENTSFLRDEKGNILSKIGYKNREKVNLNEVPSLIIQTLLGVEDENFFSHNGLSFKNIILNVFFGLFTNKKIVGASTITQQLARNLFLSNKVSFSRKIKEAWLAINLNRYISKEEILEIYLNYIFFGESCYGIQSAGKTFFKKKLDQLSVNEIAFLIALIKGPSYYLKRPEKALERKNYVLKRMNQLNLISKKTYLNLLNQPLSLVKKEEKKGEYDHLVLEVKKQLMENYKLQPEDGYNIYLTLNPNMQKIAYKALKTKIEEKEKTIDWRGPLKKNEKENYKIYETSNKKILQIKKDGSLYLKKEEEKNKIVGKIKEEDFLKYKNKFEEEDFVFAERLEAAPYWKLINPPVLNGVAIVIDPNTGKILTMVSGRGLYYSYLNGIDLVKSPGSVAKLIPLVAALEKGYDLKIKLPDNPVYISPENDLKIIKKEEREFYKTQPGKVVKNFDDNYMEEATLEEAIIFSKNIPIIFMTKLLGERCKITAQKMNILKENQAYFLSSSLGSIYTDLGNFSRGMCSITNGLLLDKIYYVERIEDLQGEIIFKENSKKTEEKERIFKKSTIDTLFQVGKKVKEKGTRGRLDKVGEWACKTGTSDHREAAFIAWNQNYLVYILVYSIDNEKVEGLWGSNIPLYIGREILLFIDQLELEKAKEDGLIEEGEEEKEEEKETKNQ